MNNNTLNRLADIINTNAYLFNSEDLRELHAIQNELERDMVLFEKEIQFNETLIHDNVKLRMKIDKRETTTL